MPKINREHISVARLLCFLQAKCVRIAKSGKPHSSTDVACLAGAIEDAVDEMGKEWTEEEIMADLVLRLSGGPQ